MNHVNAKMQTIMGFAIIHRIDSDCHLFFSQIDFYCLDGPVNVSVDLKNMMIYA